MTYIVVVIGDTSPKNRFINEDAAALAVPGIDGVMWSEACPDLCAMDFSARNYIESIAPSNLQLVPAYNGMPVVPNKRYRTVQVTLPKFHGCGPYTVVQPATWDSEFQNDLDTGHMNGIADEVSRGWDQGRILGRMYTAICNNPGDCETYMYSKGFEAEWTAAGFDPVTFRNSLVNGYLRFKARDPVTPICVPFITPETFNFGNVWDKTASFARSVIDGMDGAASANLVVTEHAVETSWARNYATSANRPFWNQLGTAPKSEADVIGALNQAVSEKPFMIQVHRYQAAIAGKWATARRSAGLP